MLCFIRVAFRVSETKAHEHTWLKIQILSTDIGQVLTDQFVLGNFFLFSRSVTLKDLIDDSATKLTDSCPM